MGCSSGWVSLGRIRTAQRATWFDPPSVKPKERDRAIVSERDIENSPRITSESLTGILSPANHRFGASRSTMPTGRGLGIETANPVSRPPRPGTNLSGPGNRLPSHTLPPQPTRLIDREEDRARLGDLLCRTETRLLTLTGPGGVGKTRLAIAAVERALEHFPGGVWFVDLTPLADSALVLPTIARVVGVRNQLGQDPAKALAGFLDDRAALLVLDNFEHVLAAAPALEALLAASPVQTLLVTSREPLQCAGNRSSRCSPCPCPAS